MCLLMREVYPLARRKERSAMITTAVAIQWETNLDQAQKRAKQENKPLLIDFNAAPE